MSYPIGSYMLRVFWVLRLAPVIDAQGRVIDVVPL